MWVCCPGPVQHWIKEQFLSEEEVAQREAEAKEAIERERRRLEVEVCEIIPILPVSYKDGNTATGILDEMTCPVHGSKLSVFLLYDCACLAVQENRKKNRDIKNRQLQCLKSKQIKDTDGRLRLKRTVKTRRGPPPKTVRSRFLQGHNTRRSTIHMCSICNLRRT